MNPKFISFVPIYWKFLAQELSFHIHNKNIRMFELAFIFISAVFARRFFGKH